jgi:light-regulated signal transduction histidine kinase (bacteriophytochrome)
MTGLKSNDIVGKNAYSVLPDLEKKWLDVYAPVALTGTPVRFEDYSASLDKYYDVAAFSPEPGYFATIISDISEQKKYEMQIRNFNIELEKKVKERTAELETANHELESFSYSVSHDLRAPLRSINGFAQIVTEEYKYQLDPELLRYFDLIRKNASMMGNLVDDLLNFSRLGRQSITRKPVNTSKLVREVIDLLQPELLSKKIQVQTGDLPDCEADPSLLRQVFMNLISNAVKFTNRAASPQIEIGFQPNFKRGQDEVSCYFIKDNGVGFDMKFYDKLFGVFQRLHRAEDYEGTGVGLAIVHRIVEKHGGKVWAEAAIGQGATFYFTLGELEHGK